MSATTDPRARPVEHLVPADRRWVAAAGITAAQHMYRDPVDEIDVDSSLTPGLPEADFWQEGTNYFSKAITLAAWELLDNARVLSLGTGTNDAFTDAVRWLAETAEQYGFLDGGSPAAAPSNFAYDLTDAGIRLPALPASGWPDGRHLRLHYLADIGHGWFCRDCGIGLIDACRDDDVVTDASGRRLVDPQSPKRLPTRDHDIPRQLGGSDGPGNLSLVCRPCNSSKGAS